MAGIGEQILTARKAKGLTQDALAEALNVSRSTVANWENGRRIPDGETLLRLSKALEYSFETETAFRQEAEPDKTEDAAADTADAGIQSEQAQDQVPPAGKPGILQDKRMRGMLIGLLIVILLFAAWFFLLREQKPAAFKDQDGTSYTVGEFQTPAKNEAGKAYLRLEPSVQITEGETYNYWMYNIPMYEENGVACSVNRVEEFIFSGNNKLLHRTYGAGDIQAYGVSLDIAPHGEWWFGGGFPVQNVIGLGIRVYCTDENDETLCFTGYLPLSEK